MLGSRDVRIRRAWWVAAALLPLTICLTAAAQPRRRPGMQTAQGTWSRYATFADFDGSFQFCRLQFRNSTTGDGDGWGVDWPRADQNLSIRFSELTRAPVGMDADNDPKSLLLTAKIGRASCRERV